MAHAVTLMGTTTLVRVFALESVSQLVLTQTLMALLVIPIVRTTIRAILQRYVTTLLLQSATSPSTAD